MGKNAQVVCSFFADDDAGLRLVKKDGGGADPKQDQHPHHQKRENRETPTHKQASIPRSTHSKKTVGSALLSHNPPVAVPSAQKGLTSRFGKDTGCNPLAKTTNTTKTSNTPTKRAKPTSQ